MWKGKSDGRCSAVEPGNTVDIPESISTSKVIAGNRRILFALCIITFALRVIYRIFFTAGEETYWRYGYQDYRILAENMQQLSSCLLPNNAAVLQAGMNHNMLGRKCAYWPPGYPFFLSTVTRGEQDYLAIVLSQAMVSVGVVLCAFFLGKHLFGSSTGLLASLFVSLYPYYAVHDTALQETGMHTFSVALSVVCLYKAARTRSWLLWTCSGCLLGLSALIRASTLPFVALALLWVILLSNGSLRARCSAAVLVLSALGVVLIPWITRNFVVLGRPVFTTQTGRFLWVGNNPETLSHYPSGSIDMSEAEAWQGLSQSELDEIQLLSTDELGQRDWFFGRAVDYIIQNPSQTLRAATVKVWSGFSWNLSPSKPGLANFTYFLSYAPHLALGITGLLLTWRRWRELSLIYFLFIAFIAGTSIFWAHTSHRTHLDVYIMVFSAYAVRTMYSGRARWIQQARKLFLNTPTKMC